MMLIIQQKMQTNNTENMSEQEEINASYQRLLDLDACDTCSVCKNPTEAGVSFCNALCENQFIMTTIQMEVEDAITIWSNSCSYAETFQTSVYTEDQPIEEYTNASKLEHGKSVYINVKKLKPVSFPDVEPRIKIAGIRPYVPKEGKTLMEELEENSIALFVARNENEQGWSDIPLSIYNLESPLNAKQTDEKFLQFVATFPAMVVHVAAPGMFYKCYYSEGYECASIHVKFYFHKQRNPTVEFRRVFGCRDIHGRIYGSFNNFINDILETPVLEQDTQSAAETVTMTREEHVATIEILLKFLKTDPKDGIKVVAQVAMEKDADDQIEMCNQIHNIIHNYPVSKLHELIVKILGFVDTITTDARCLLSVARKTLILQSMKEKISMCIDEPSVHAGVKKRARLFLETPDYL